LNSTRGGDITRYNAPYQIGLELGEPWYNIPNIIQRVNGGKAANIALSLSRSLSLCLCSSWSTTAIPGDPTNHQEKTTALAPENYGKPTLLIEALFFPVEWRSVGEISHFLSNNEEIILINDYKLYN
jgi:hypothetical protein